MKKISLALVLLAGGLAAATSLGAQSVYGVYGSVGLGTYNSGTLDVVDFIEYSTDLQAGIFSNSRFLSLRVGIQGRMPEGKYVESDRVAGTGDEVEFTYYDHIWLTGSALLKLPVDLDGIVVSPMAGIAYDLNLLFADGTTDLKENMTDEQKLNLNQFWFQLGLSADVENDGFVTGLSVLYSFGAPDQFERDWLDANSSRYVNIGRLDISVYVGFTLD